MKIPMNFSLESGMYALNSMQFVYKLGEVAIIIACHMDGANKGKYEAVAISTPQGTLGLVCLCGKCGRTMYEDKAGAMGHAEKYIGDAVDKAKPQDCVVH